MYKTLGFLILVAVILSNLTGSNAWLVCCFLHLSVKQNFVCKFFTNTKRNSSLIVKIMAPSCSRRNSTYFDYPQFRITNSMKFSVFPTFPCVFTFLTKNQVKTRQILQNKYCISYFYFIFWVLHNCLRCDKIGTNIFGNICCKKRFTTFFLNLVGGRGEGCSLECTTAASIRRKNTPILTSIIS